MHAPRTFYRCLTFWLVMFIIQPFWGVKKLHKRSKRAFLLSCTRTRACMYVHTCKHAYAHTYACQKYIRSVSDSGKKPAYPVEIFGTETLRVYSAAECANFFSTQTTEIGVSERSFVSTCVSITGGMNSIHRAVVKTLSLRPQLVHCGRAGNKGDFASLTSTHSIEGNGFF